MTIMIGANLTETYIALENGNTPALGDIYTGDDGKRYRFVLYSTGVGSVAAVAGNFTYVLAPSGASAGLTTTVTSDLSDSAGVGAGMLMSAPSATVGLYCWVQIAGYATLTTALTAGADGNALTPVGATDGTLDVSALVTDHVCATAIDASARIVLLHSMG
jgi:hypothetical protein